MTTPPLLLNLPVPGADGAVAFADASRLVLAAQEGAGRCSVHVLPLDGGAPTRLTGPARGAPTALACSPGGTRAAVAAGATLQVLPLEGEGQPVPLRGHRRGTTVWGLDWLDERRLLSSGTDGLWIVWDVLEGAPTAQVDARRARAWGLVNDRLCVVGRPSVRGRVLRLTLSAPGSSEPATLLRHRLPPDAEEPLCAAALRPGTEELYLLLSLRRAGRQCSTLLRCVGGEVQALQALEGPPDAPAPPASALAFAGPRWLVQVGWRRCTALYLQTGQEHPCPTPLRLHPAGRVLGRDGRIAHLGEGEAALPPETAQALAAERRVAFDPLGERLAVLRPGRVELWGSGAG